APGKSEEAAPALMHLAWSSRAALAVAPLQDLLNLGAESRMNVPGRASGNWRWRSREDMLSPAAFACLQELTQTSGRLRPAATDQQMELAADVPARSATSQV